MLLYEYVPVVPDAASAAVASRPAGSYVNADVPRRIRTRRHLPVRVIGER
jgi:hypothetical protein